MNNPLDDRATTVSPAECAERIGLKPSTLRNQRWRGDGPPFVRVGGRVRYRLVDIAEWLESRVRTSTSDVDSDD